MSLDVREKFTEQGEPLIHASVCFLSVGHWAISRQSPKADFRMCIKGLLLAFRRDGVVHLLDLRATAVRSRGCDTDESDGSVEIQAMNVSPESRTKHFNRSAQIP